MNAQWRDLRRIRVPLVVLVVTLGLSAGLVWTSKHQNDGTRLAHDAAAADADAAQAKADAAVIDNANVQTFKSVFDTLKARGVIGTEQRLPWVEYFTAASMKNNPASLTLRIEPRRTLEDAPPTPEPLENLQFYASKFTLDANLLHDVDILRLVDNVKAIPGASIIRTCDIKRAPEGANAAHPYLLVMECEGDIITLDAPPANPGAPQ
jgi:hypothetical protein